MLDAVINFALGVLLLLFPQPIVEALGIPQPNTAFYPSIFGAVLFGIGVALVIEWRRKPAEMVGLGLGGAIAINFCGAIGLTGWLTPEAPFLNKNCRASRIVEESKLRDTAVQVARQFTLPIRSVPDPGSTHAVACSLNLKGSARQGSVPGRGQT